MKKSKTSGSSKREGGSSEKDVFRLVVPDSNKEETQRNRPTSTPTNTPSRRLSSSRPISSSTTLTSNPPLNTSTILNNPPKPTSSITHMAATFGDVAVRIPNIRLPKSILDLGRNKQEILDHPLQVDGDF